MYKIHYLECFTENLIDKVKKQKIIYIAGAGHSGSTILDMVLAAGEEVIGLGEVKTILDPHTKDIHYKSYCSCGQKASKCSFWEGFQHIPQIENSIKENYEALLSYFQKKYGQEKVLLDSSKNSYRYLKYLNENYDLKVLLLTRNYRSWIYSRKKSAKIPMLQGIFQWIFLNFKIKFQLKKIGVKPIHIGYEEWALYPEYVLRKITKKLQINFSEKMLHPELSHSHIISGNIARIDSDKKKSITYDARWLLSSGIQFWSIFLFPFYRFNRKQVYSNLSDDKTADFYLFGQQKRKQMENKFN